jgi:glycosyltransferase involved in cell wall biosynthesis
LSCNYRKKRLLASERFRHLISDYSANDVTAAIALLGIFLAWAGSLFTFRFLCNAGSRCSKYPAMKVLIDHDTPFSLAHGGFQIQIEQTLAALRKIGVSVEHLLWWDDTQKGDIIHYFGRMPASHIELAQRKGAKVVIEELLTGAGSRTRAQLRLQKAIIRIIRSLAPRQFLAPFNWDAYARADAIVANTFWEAHLMNYLFDAEKGKIHIVPNGVEEVFLCSEPARRGEWLVCTATITERKRVVELAEAAVLAQTPVWIIGRPYSEADPYAMKFLNLAVQNPRLVRYDGPVIDRAALARIYRQARGFVLLSTMETLSLSAGEAAACQCPLFLSDLPWARSVYGDNASYCPIATPHVTATYLKRFYDAAPGMNVQIQSPSWIEVAEQFKGIYESVLKRKTTSQQ